ncbi:hypothetical protein Desor_3788 [Desulfosporosinus orientis DSM 765]|uniref:Uncharacterized protein n=1 Tax=Desulfosporosinus orientis (strain ATCC 19365 / DSM 765 / NCIMB 8382 / VKM B-1628 / Singapore I) TaxID=768706 RepID=G7W9B2_DESOD|nr:hypothetical protein [Desulfosporosinus orientis]AET69249.1 hypothetical protein Desor_3788 [Desulfosporosinus orientis DSM 765]
MFDRLIRIASLKKTPLLLGMMGINFLLTGVDVLIAHSENNFFRWELIPLIYTPLAVLAILALLVVRSNILVKRVFQIVMGIGVFVGVIGTLFHLTGNATFSRESLYRLFVQGSPVAAPIAFAGISCYALVSEGYRGTSRQSKLMILVGLGFLGSVAAAFLDHARIVFIPGYTLIPLVTGSLAVIACFYTANNPVNTKEISIFLWIMALNLFAGVLGFGFHLLGDLAGTQGIVWARMMYRNPLLGPLLFSNLAFLGGLSLLPEQVVSHVD